MNSLKKVLTKDDVKRYQKSKNYQIGHQSNIKQNSISDRNNWTDINQLIECVIFNEFRGLLIRNHCRQLLSRN